MDELLWHSGNNLCFKTMNTVAAAGRTAAANVPLDDDDDDARELALAVADDCKQKRKNR